jgi:hypothetical protein
VTLYLKAVVGETRYLIAASCVVDVAPAEGGEADKSVDCRVLFAAPGDGPSQGPSQSPGHGLIIEDEAGAAVRLIVDRVDGLVDVDDDALRPLPPIGRFGAAIDAVSVPADGDVPALRLRIGSALFSAAPLGVIV